MTDAPRLFLIDGHALAYRAYFALTRVGDGGRWITKAGEPTAGTYGFVSILLRLLEQQAPEYLAVSFDTGRTFRDDLYAEYKATRDKMPDDLALQLDRIRQVVLAFGIPILEADGFEADDVLGTVARRAAEQGVRVVILSGDRDLLQLVDDSVHVELAGQKLSEAIDYGPQEVAQKFGVTPGQLVDYKALVGDTSDNIPGVKGIGEKTAVGLIQQYGSLEAVYDNLQDIPERFRSKLETGRESAFLSRRLATIELEVPIEFDLEACRAHDYDRSRVVELFRELEFRSLLARMGPEAETPARQMALFAAPASAPQPDGVFHIVGDIEALHALVARLAQASEIAVDVETTGIDAMRADLVGLSLAVEPGQGYYLPVGHLPHLAGGPQLAWETVAEALRPALAAAAKPKVGHNLKYDLTVLARHGLPVSPLGFDTMLGEWLCDPSSRSLGLKDLAFVRLGLEMTHITQLIGSGRQQRSMAEVPIADAAPYAAADAEVCLRLKPLLEKELEDKEHGSLFRDLEMPLVSVLAEMEMAGVALDLPFLAELSLSLGGRILELEADITRQVGHPFNLNSTQQLAAVLFQELGLTPPAAATSRRLPACWRSFAMPTRWSNGSSSIASCPSCDPRTPTPCLSRSIPAPGGCTRRSRKPAPSPAAWHPPIPTCRTSPSAPSWAARSGGPSSPRPGSGC